MINKFHTSKYLVAVTLLLLTLGASGNATAIGLGDMDVKSNLGQPFRAKVKIHGINSITDESCFKLVNSGDGSESLKSANFKLTNLVGEEATLLVSSNIVINEPILNISLITECDNTTSVRRDYVLLIDPLLTAEADINSSTNVMLAPAANNQISIKAKSKISRPSVATDSENDFMQAQVAQASAKNKLNKRHETIASRQQNLKINSGRVLDDDLSAIATKTAVKGQMNSKINSNVGTTRKISSDLKKGSMPHLSISGGSNGSAKVSDHSLALRLDSELHMTRNENPHAFLAEAEVLDEMTVMNNRLANLEKQLVTLQIKNTELEIVNKSHLKQIEHDKELSNILRWLTYLLIAFGLVGIAIAADWWRRRNQRLKLNIDSAWNYEGLHNDASIPFSSNLVDEHYNQDIGISKIETKSLDTSVSDFVKLHNTPITPTSMTNIVESVIIEEDILDHADVFLSHGRTNLAIQLLQNHLSEYPNRSVTVWLFLLDLIAKDGSEEEYKKAASECKKHFNIELPEFSIRLAIDGNGIESFGAITSHLIQVWQTDAAVSFLDNLIFNNRLQPRAGFNQCTFEELALLKSIAQEHQQTAKIFPLFQKAPNIKIEVKKLVISGDKIKKSEKIKEIALEKSEEKPDETSFDFKLID